MYVGQPEYRLKYSPWWINQAVLHRMVQLMKKKRRPTTTGKFNLRAVNWWRLIMSLGCFAQCWTSSPKASFLFSLSSHPFHLRPFPRTLTFTCPSVDLLCDIQYLYTFLRWQRKNCFDMKLSRGRQLKLLRRTGLGCPFNLTGPGINYFLFFSLTF